MARCVLCDPSLGPILAESTHWRLVLNRNQNLLGKCFLALRRHLVAVPDLDADEWLNLHRQIALATQTLERAFQPDHFNYAFLQNQDPHVHLHIIPRYAQPRSFAGAAFHDPDWPDHYAPDRRRTLSDEQLTALAGLLRSSVREMEAEHG